MHNLQKPFSKRRYTIIARAQERPNRKEESVLIEVKHLTKRYGNHTAVSDLSFTITPGKIYGFLGPNGAGKSTTMNIITGCLAATEGDVKIGGFDIFEQPKQAKRLVGYLPEMPPLYMDQTVLEYLHFVAKAKGLKKQEMASEIEKVVQETRIEDVANKLIKHLSKGYRQRVGIAQALLGNPEIIILDEPTVGLDPAQIIEIRDLIKKLGESHTVILSSHILSEVQAICDEALIIHKGKLRAFDTLENLNRTLSAGCTIALRSETDAAELQQLLEPVEQITSIEVKEETEQTCAAVLTVAEDDLQTACRSVFLAFANAGRVLLQLNPVKATLEDIFMEITSDRDEEATLDALAEPEAYEDDEPEESDESEEPDEPDASDDTAEPEKPDETSEEAEAE